MSDFAPERGGLQVLMQKIPGFTAGAALDEPFYFQCPPTEQFQVVHEHSHTDYDTLGLGQLSRPGSLMLRQVSFGTLFIDYEMPWTLPDTNSNLNPKEHTELLRRVLATGTPFRLTVYNADLWDEPDLDMPATLRSLTVAEKAGEVDARYIDVAFVEFRGPKLASFKQPAAKKLPASLLIRSLPSGRRTLAQLAKFYYGSASRVTPIRKANGFLSGVPNNQNLVEKFKSRPTLKIRIPKV